jgi:hypothetical protein
MVGTLPFKERCGGNPMTATNELDAVLCQEELPDEFSRLSSSSPQRDKPSVASMLSGIVPASQQDEVTCPLLLRRHLLIPAWRAVSAAGASRHV